METHRVIGIATGGLCLMFQTASAGDLSFSEPTFLIPGHGVIVVGNGEIDSDDDLDIVVAGLSGNVTVFRNQGGGEFGPAEPYSAGSSQLDLVLKDFNGDGHLDLALANFLGSGNVSVLLNQGDGTFGPAMNYSTPQLTNPRAIAAGDLDADGDADLLVGDGFLSSKVVLVNNGIGTFNEALPFVSGGTSIQMALSDLDHDGDLDAISVFSGVWLHPNNGDATFAPAISLLPQQTTAVAISDLDGDGHDDFAVTLSSSTTQQAVVFLNAGDASFEQTSYPIDSLARDIAIADLNGDGHPDIASSHVAPVNRVNVLLNNGDGAFADGGDFAPGNYPQSLTLGDVDGDARIDIITANQFSDPPTVGILFNQTLIPLIGDIDGNEIVNVDDLLAVISAWGACPGAPAACPSDIAPPRGNGVVDVDDLLTVISNWS